MDLAKEFLDMKKAAGVASRRPLLPTRPALSSALLTAAVFAATLVTAALFFLFAPLAFTLLFVVIVLSALSRRSGFVWWIWILLCVHDAFLDC